MEPPEAAAPPAAPGLFSKGARRAAKRRRAEREQGRAAAAAAAAAAAEPAGSGGEGEEEREGGAPAEAVQVEEAGPSAGGAAGTWRELGLSEWLGTVCGSLGLRQPTPVQAGCVPAILVGRNVVGTAQTGSGKTAAFALPILQRLAEDPFGVFALVLTPTRELAFQIADQFKALGAGMGVQTAVVVGGLEVGEQGRQLARRPHVVVATPGRLRDHFTHDPALVRGFQRLRFLVLDEADRVLDPTFEAELKVILRPLPKRRQTLLFSATLTRSIEALRQVALKDAYHFAAVQGLKTAATLRQQYVLCPAKVKEVYLFHLLKRLEALEVRSAIIFVGTVKKCRLLDHLLDEMDVKALCMHSKLPMKKRLQALERFKSGLAPILLATDVAARGLDIPTVDLVINYDLPKVPRDYVHRVGRTARAGRGGRAVSLVSQYEVDLVREVEAVIEEKLTLFETEEKEVMKDISYVFAARRAAILAIEELEADK